MTAMLASPIRVKDHPGSGRHLDHATHKAPSTAEACTRCGYAGEGSHHGMDDYVEIKYLCIGDVLK